MNTSSHMVMVPVADYNEMARKAALTDKLELQVEALCSVLCDPYEPIAHLMNTAATIADKGYDRACNRALPLIGEFNYSWARSETARDSLSGASIRNEDIALVEEIIEELLQFWDKSRNHSKDKDLEKYRLDIIEVLKAAQDLMG